MSNIRTFSTKELKMRKKVCRNLFTFSKITKLNKEIITIELKYGVKQCKKTTTRNFFYMRANNQTITDFHPKFSISNDMCPDI